MTRKENGITHGFPRPGCLVFAAFALPVSAVSTTIGLGHETRWPAGFRGGQ